MGRTGRRSKNKTPEVINKGIPQLDRLQRVNRFPPIEPLNEEQLEKIHDASMDILEQMGVEVVGEMALEVFRKAGAEVSKEGIVKMDRGLVMQGIANSTSRIYGDTSQS